MEQTNAQLSHPNALPGLWRERGGLDDLVRLDVAAVTAGMVVVAKQNEPWQDKPELRWQVWPEDLENVS
jgi:hypothetical protein